MQFPSVNEQMDIIRRNAVDLLPEEDLVKKLEKSFKTGKPMVVKLGADPSRPDLHIGHAVVLKKMREFQDLGHQAILIVGDFTGMIGDPTGKSKTRPPLTLEQARENGQSYFEQAGKILNADTLKIVYNSEWLSKMTFQDVIELTAKYTVAQMLERDDFTKRYKTGVPISIHELLYPLAQAMDSVAIKSDIELGGTDQKFNLLVGREIQRAYGVEPQCILTMPILEGTDGVEKMSKSLDNYIGITDAPRDMFGKAMSIPDKLMARWAQYATFKSGEALRDFKEKLESGKMHPRMAKVAIAQGIVELYHGIEEAKAAFEEFERIFVKKDVPDEIEEFVLKSDSPNMNVQDILVQSGMTASKGEAKRLIQGGGLSIDGEKISDINLVVDLSQEKIFKAGKRKFLKIRA
ncbi:MAG: tyrosine--tRNA ligase [Bacteroidota bacterium]